jgi:oxygen-independent coproporphyrinogen-3 oxidase
MIDFSISALRGAGYAPYYLYRQKYTAGGYENVGWCRSGFEGVYNIIMMEELHSVLSLGAGGVTKLVDAATGKIERRANKKYPKEYVESGGETVGEKLSPADFRPGTKKHLLSSQ